MSRFSYDKQGGAHPGIRWLSGNGAKAAQPSGDCPRGRTHVEADGYVARTVYRTISLALFFGVLVWTVDVITDRLLSTQHRGILYAVFNGSTHQILVRAFTLLSFTMFGVITAIMLVKRKRAEEAERHSRTVAEAISSVTLKFLECGSAGEVAKRLLEQALYITQAEFGCVFDIDIRKQAHILAISGRAWENGADNESRAKLIAEVNQKGFSRVFLNQSSFFSPMLEGETVLLNAGDGNRGNSKGIPEGFPSISCLLSVPLKTSDAILGMISLANKTGGFARRDKENIEALAGTAAVAFRAARSEEDQARAQEQLRQAVKMEAVGRLAGGIAHDFNNLLTVVAGYSEQGRVLANPNERLCECFLEIEKAAKRGASLTQQLLAFSRRQHLEPRVVNLNDVLSDMKRMLARLIGEDIELESRTTEDLWSVRVDPGQFQQVIVNLAVNARDAMPDGGKITLETANVHLDDDYTRTHPGAVAGDFAMLAVVDEGVGMTDDMKERLFEPFFTTKEPGKGTGLGLATCYGIVKQSGGYIWVDSKRGHGTSVRIYLPRVSGTPVVVSEGRKSREPQRGSETVLLVEDEPSVRQLAAEVLRTYGYTVLEGTNGEEALHIVQGRSRAPIHLLLTDIVMPRMGGMELVERLKSTRPDLRKVLFITGHADTPIPTQKTKGFRVEFLQKPFTPSYLAHKVRDMLDH